MQEEKLEEKYKDLTVLKVQNKEYLILGTAHVSKQSAQDVKEIIEKELPHCVCVELDDNRYKSITESSYKKLNIFEIFKQKKVFYVLINIILSSYQKNIAKNMNTQSGAEMIEAINISKENDIKFYLCDRDAQITLLRVWRMSSLKTKWQILNGLISSVFSKEEVSSEEIEEMKSSQLDSVFEEFSKTFPEVKKILIDERDTYLAKNIYKIPENKVFVVIGAGHKKGLIENLKNLHEGCSDLDVSELEYLPKRSILPVLFASFFSILIFVFIFWGVFTGDYKSVFSKSLYWFIIKSCSTFVSGLLCLANPVALILGSLWSPFSTFIPVIKTPFIAGISQAFFAKPTIEDLENISDDSSKIKGFYKNKFLKAILVSMVMGIGSSLGTFLALKFIIA